MPRFDFITVSIAILIPSSYPELDLYQVESEKAIFVLCRGGEYPLTIGNLDRFRRRGSDELFISREPQACISEPQDGTV